MIPNEVLDLKIDRRGRPKSVKPCILCGKKGYALVGHIATVEVEEELI